MISQEKFNQIELDHGCGYWNECCDRSCPCAITTESKGLRQDIWDSFKKEQEELIKEYEREEFDFAYYTFQIKCVVSKEIAKVVKVYPHFVLCEIILRNKNCFKSFKFDEVERVYN